MNQKRLFRNLLCLIFLCTFTFLLSHMALAIGEGDGGGGGPSVPLVMDWSFPANGETGVSVNTIIQCKFSHNVAHFDVAPRNAGKFTMTKEDGTSVDVEVYQGDAQVEFDKRQYVYLYPKKQLEQYTTYIVTAQEGVQAKNGMATEQIQTFRFITGSSNSVPVAVMTEKPEETVKDVKSESQSIEKTMEEKKQNTVTAEPKQDPKLASEKEENTQKKMKNAQAVAKTKPMPWILPVFLTVLGLVLAGSISFTWYRKMKD